MFRATNSEAAKILHSTRVSHKFDALPPLSTIFGLKMEQKKTTSTPNKKPSKQRFRLILQEEGTFAERWAMKVQPLQLKWLAAGSVIIVAVITYALIAWTPLREVVVPGYMTTEARVMQEEAIQTADSLSNILEAQGRYIANLKAIFSGELPPQSMEIISNTAPPETPPSSLSQQPGEALTGLRSRVEEEDAFAIGKPGSLESSGVWLPPVEGQISSPWNPQVGHWGVDLVAPEDSPVKAVGSGTVVFAGFTSGGGHTIMVQHPGDRVSVYMHNSRLEVQSGDRVEQGELLAFIGNSGDHSSGPHLHFEWWESGTAIDPQLRMSLK